MIIESLMLPEVLSEMVYYDYEGRKVEQMLVQLVKHKKGL